MRWRVWSSATGVGRRKGLDRVDGHGGLDDVPIGIGDSLPKNRCCCLGCYRGSFCLGLQNALGAGEMVLVPSDCKDVDSRGCLRELGPKLPVGLAPAMERASC